MGSILIVVGVIVNFFGRAWFKHVIAGVGGGMTFLIVMLLCSVMGMLNSLEGHGKGHIALAVLAFIISIGLAVLTGFILKKVVRAGAAVLGALGGFFLGFALYNFALSWS